MHQNPAISSMSQVTDDVLDEELQEMIMGVNAENQALELHNAHLLNLLTEYGHHLRLIS